MTDRQKHDEFWLIHLAGVSKICTPPKKKSVFGGGGEIVYPNPTAKLIMIFERQQLPPSDSLTSLF